MENDDEPAIMNSLSPSNLMSTTTAPDHFLLSIYKENQRFNSDSHSDYQCKSLSTIINGEIPLTSISGSYKCCLCRKIVNDATLTCAKCVNTGRFCPSDHTRCSNKRRQNFLALLNVDEQKDVQEYTKTYSIHTPPHLQCSDQMYLLKKFKTNNKTLRTEYQTRTERTMQIRQMLEEKQIRKNRLLLARQSLLRIREQNDQKKIVNTSIQERNAKTRVRIQTLEKKLNEIKMVVKASNAVCKKKNETRISDEYKLHNLRCQRLNEVYKYIFPIEHVTLIEENLALTMQALSSAQRPIGEATNNDWPENDEALNVDKGRYRIVNSCLAVDGDYQVPKLLMAADVDGTAPVADSSESSLSNELHEVLSALSHACQLINIIAVYLHITLPFRLHQLEFSGDNLSNDRLRADIAKLNANVISCCISQGIPIENTHVAHTLENLYKLLTFKQYPSRPKPVIYSQQYIDMIEEEVNEISRAYVTDYWFDDVDKDITDLLNSDEWETVSQDYNIPDDPSIHERVGPLPSGTNQHNQPHHSSVMSGSIGYLMNTGSNLFSSVFRNISRS